jgi:glycerate 2-kinase
MPEAAEGNSESVALAMRATAAHLFHHAMHEASVVRGFQRHVSCDHGVLRICDDLYDLQCYSRVFVVSMGKAAHSMVSALITQAGDRFEGIVSGLASADSQVRGFRYFEGGHPLPNGESVAAANAILKSLASLDASSLAIFMLSGGGSAMVEKPIDDEICLPDLISTYRTLIHSAAPITEINAVRKHLSAVKGGRLARAAHPAHQVSLLISDVPDHTPDALASGPTMADATSIEDCYAITSKYGMTAEFPTSVRELFQRRALEETPKSGDPEFSRSRWWTVLSNAAILEHVRKEGESLGFHCEIDNSCDDWEYTRARDYLLDRVRNLRKNFAKVCLINGGEVTVKVTGEGIGGRNQQFALSCAQPISGKNVTILSAGTDGIDGNSSAAGAIVDGETVEKGKRLGLDAQDYLSRNDAATFFDRTGDAIVTGPSGNNLRDLRIFLAY